METIQQPKETQARKEHRCDFCNEKILKGQKYIASTHVYDYIYTWRSHKWCDKLCTRLKMHQHAEDYGVDQDHFVGTVSEEHHEILLKQLPEISGTEISRQLWMVPFKEKLWFVIRHYKKLDETLEDKTNWTKEELG